VKYIITPRFGLLQQLTRNHLERHATLYSGSRFPSDSSKYAGWPLVPIRRFSFLEVLIMSTQAQAMANRAN